MPKYTIKSPDGRILKVIGDRPPTQEEAAQLFGQSSSVNEMNPAQRFAQKAGNAAPLVGGIIGGLGGGAVGAAAGGVGAIPGSAVGTAAGTGAGLAVKSGLEQLFQIPTTQTQGDRAREAVVQPLAAGALDAATGGIMKGAGKITGNVIEKALPGLAKKLSNETFKEGVKQTRNIVRKGEETLGEQALKQGELGTSSSIFSNAVKKIQELEDMLQGMLKSSKTSVPINHLDNVTKPLIDKWRKAGNEQAAVSLENRLANLRNIWGENIPVKEANKVKRTLYEEARNAYGNVASESLEGIKSAARGIKTSIEKNVGKEVSEINKKLSYYGRIADSMSDKISREGRNKIIDLTTAVVGTGLAPFTKGASLLAPLANTTIGQTGIAQTLNAVPRIIKKVGESVPGKVIKTGADILRRIGNQGISDQIN